jgi:hypothetical protein
MENKIELFVKEWMDSHESDTFIKNKNGDYFYTSECGRTSINLTCYFEDLLEDFILKQEEDDLGSAIKEMTSDVNRVYKPIINYIYTNRTGEQEDLITEIDKIRGESLLEEKGLKDNHRANFE